ncbi:unnamed protein product, partial [Prorocentrum cordatum]
AMAAKLKALIEHAQTVREEFHKVRQTHVQRIEDEQREREQQEKTEDNPDQADEAEPEATHQASTTASQTASQSRQGMKKFLRAGSAAPQAFSTEKLTKLKSQKAQSSEVKAKDALQTHEEKKRFEALPKQEQIKRSVWRRGVSARDLKKYLNEELDQEQACLGLIWAVLMLWFFCMGAFSHMRLEEAHAQEFAVIFDIQENANFAFSGSVPHENGRMGHKTMNDINSIPDFWSWMNLGFVPLLFPAEGSWDTDEMRANVGTMCNSYKAALEGFGGYDDDMLSGTTDTTGIHGNMNTDSGCPEAEAPGPAWPEGFLGAEGQQGHTYLYYHSIVGGARMQQEYMPVKSCPDEVFHGSLFSGNCVPGMEPNYMLEPEPQQAFFPYDTQYLNTSTRVFLKAHTSQADLRAQLRELEDQVWLSPHTAKVEIVYTTYNPHLNSMTLTFINFFMNRAGHIHKVIEPISFFLQPYNTWSDYVWDVLWCVMVVKLAFDEIPDLYSNIRLHGGCRAGLKKYMSLGNMVDWLNIVPGLARAKIAGYISLYCDGGGGSTSMISMGFFNFRTRAFQALLSASNVWIFFAWLMCAFMCFCEIPNSFEGEAELPTSHRAGRQEELPDANGAAIAMWGWTFKHKDQGHFASLDWVTAQPRHFNWAKAAPDIEDMWPKSDHWLVGASGGAGAGTNIPQKPWDAVLRVLAAKPCIPALAAAGLSLAAWREHVVDVFHAALAFSEVYVLVWALSLR